MSRRVGGALGIVMAAAALANAQEDGPPLNPPAPAPSVEASSPPSQPRPAPDPPTRRPFLVIPGVTAPAAATRSSGRTTAGNEPSVPRTPDPLLAGPEPPTSRGTTAPLVTIPLTLEPIPDGAAADDEKSETAKARPAPTLADGDRIGGARHAPGTILGRLLGFDSGRDEVQSAIRIESKADPAADAAMKRRIEKAVRETLGDHASEVEVRVQGRNVLIRARPSRFWRRGSVRRALDSFQLPSGYHGRAELID